MLSKSATSTNTHETSYGLLSDPVKKEDQTLKIGKLGGSYIALGASTAKSINTIEVFICTSPQNYFVTSSDYNNSYSQHIANAKIKIQAHLAQLEKQAQKLIQLIRTAQNKLPIHELNNELNFLNKQILGYRELLRAREIIPDPTNIRYSRDHKIHPTEWDKFSESAMEQKWLKTDRTHINTFPLLKNNLMSDSPWESDINKLSAEQKQHRLKYLEKAEKIIIDNGVGTCGDITTLIAAGLCRSEVPMDIIHIKSLGHYAIVINPPLRESNALYPKGFKREWEQSQIVDGWLHFICPGDEYLSRFKEEISELYRLGLILDDKSLEEWLAALDIAQEDKIYSEYSSEFVSSTNNSNSILDLFAKIKIEKDRIQLGLKKLKKDEYAGDEIIFEDIDLLEYQCRAEDSSYLKKDMDLFERLKAAEEMANFNLNEREWLKNLTFAYEIYQNIAEDVENYCAQKNF